MPKGKALPKTEEEKTAEKIANLMKDSTIDLDSVGWYLARMRPSYLPQRLRIIAEAVEAEMEYESVRNSHDPLF